MTLESSAASRRGRRYSKGEWDASPRSILRIAECVAILSGTLGCGSANGRSTEPETDVAGVYILDSVDGLPLPRASSLAGGSPSCPGMISDGELILRPHGADVLPLYNMNVWGRPVCDSVQFPVPKPVTTDAGRWRRTGATITFSSDRSAGSAGTVVLAVSPPTITSVFAGQTYRFHRVRLYNTAVSYVLISAVDQSNNRVGGAMTSWRTSDGLVGCCGVMSAENAFGIPGPPGTGSVRIWVRPPPNYSLAVTQPNPVDVPTVVGATATVGVHLTAPTTP